MTMKKAEQETIPRFDQDERGQHTQATARKWANRGYVRPKSPVTHAPESRDWRAHAPIKALRPRRLINHQVA